MNKKRNFIFFVVCILLTMVLLLTACRNGKNATSEILQVPGDAYANKDSLLHTVRFIDADGAALKTESVENGGAATAPSAPKEPGKTFLGWDRSFDFVDRDLTVSAQYTEVRESAVIVVNQTAFAGQTITIPFVIVNNPGIAGAKFTVCYDSALTLIDAENGEAFSMLDYMSSGRYDSPCNFTWDSECEMAMEDGEILSLTFCVSEAVSSGDVFEISCSYRAGDVYDENLNDVNVEVISGIITIE